MTKFTFHTPENTTGEARAQLIKAKETYGFIPNLFAYMAEAPITIEAYLMMSNLLEKSDLSPAEQQLALLTASIENDCNFCSVAHRVVGKAQGLSETTINALVKGDQIADTREAALVDFVVALVKERGRPSLPQIEAFLGAGFSERHIMELVLMISMKTLTNYINHMTKPQPNQELLDML